MCRSLADNGEICMIFTKGVGSYDLASIEFVYPNSDGVRRRNAQSGIGYRITI